MDEVETEQVSVLKESAETLHAVGKTLALEAAIEQAEPSGTAPETVAAVANAQARETEAEAAVKIARIQANAAEHIAEQAKDSDLVERLTFLEQRLSVIEGHIQRQSNSPEPSPTPPVVVVTGGTSASPVTEREPTQSGEPLVTEIGDSVEPVEQEAEKEGEKVGEELEREVEIAPLKRRRGFHMGRR